MEGEFEMRKQQVARERKGRQEEGRQKTSKKAKCIDVLVMALCAKTQHKTYH